MGVLLLVFSVGHQDANALAISHLLFTDDTLILCGAIRINSGIFVGFSSSFRLFLV